LAFHPCVLAAPNNWEGTQMTELSESRTHVAMTLDRLRAVDHRPIVGCWPSLLLVTSSASLQLDPASDLSAAQAMRISGRLLIEVTRWHESIRRHAPRAQDSTESDLMLQAEGG
jgi:hypothetical protein